MSLPLPTTMQVCSPQMTMTCVDPRTDALWRRLVERADSSVFHSPSWIQAVTETYGWEAHASVVVDEQGEPQAGLPYCRISDALGKRIVALPFSDYCDPLAADAHSWRLLADELARERCPVILRCLHNDLPLADCRFALFKQAKWHRLDLRADLDAVWGGMHDSLRRAIKKAQREGVTIRVAESEEDLRAFFDMHLKVRKYKYGLLAQPFRFFQNIWRRFMDAGQGFLLLAAHQDRIVAGDFFLVWKDTLYYKFNASLPEGLAHRPNDLVTWEGIQQGKARGLGFVDFGLSDWDQEGLARYKRKFGAEERTISFLQHSPNGPPTPAQQDLRQLFIQLTQKFTDPRVPDAVTEAAGEDLYRLFA